MPDVTHILSAIEQGDARAAEQLLPVVYEELRKLAAQRLSQEKPGQTLQATALVHEAYLRLVGGKKFQHWDNRGHFFAAAAEAMRRILVDSARRKQRPKHCGNLARVDLEQVPSMTDPHSEDLLALDEALAKLAVEEPLKAELVKLRYFAGLSVEDAARALGISQATAKRYWAYARALVLVLGDRLGEPNETFSVNLSNPANATIADSQGVGTIFDDEPRISISDVIKAEGKKRQTTLLTFTITLSAAYDQAVTMSFRTVNGTAKTSDGDYVAKTGTLTFAPGETTKTVTITVKGDSKREGNETFYLDLFGLSSNSLFTKNRGIGTILNDD